MYKVERQLNLKNRINELFSKVQGDYDMDIIADKYQNFKRQGYGDIELVEWLVTKLQAFTENHVVEDFVKSITKELNEHAMQYFVTKTAYQVNRDDSPISNSVYEKLYPITEMTVEAEIYDSVINTLSGDAIMSSYVGHLVEMASRATNKVVDTSNVSVEPYYSPGIKLDENSILVDVMGNPQVYDLKNKSLSDVSESVEIPATFNFLKDALKEFYVDKDGVATLYGDGVKYCIENVDGSYRITKGGEPIAENAVKRTLYYNGNLSPKFQKKVDAFISLYENFDKIINLDFIQKIKPKGKDGISIDLMKMNETYIVRKKQESFGIDEITECDAQSEVVDVAKDFLGVDLSPFFSNLKVEADQANSQRIQEKNMYKERLAFLESKIAKLENNEFSNHQKIQEGISLLRQEQEKYNDKYKQALADIFGNVREQMADQGFVPARMTKRMGGLKPNQMVFVSESQYNSSGYDSLVKIMDSDYNSYEVTKAALTL